MAHLPSRTRAVLTGLLAAVASVAAGHLVAGILGPGSSPMYAVGSAAIDRTPAPVKDWAIGTFGTWDKTVLIIGMVLVLLLLGGLAGLLSSSRSWPGQLIIAGFGLVGLLAVLERTGLGPLAVLSPLVSLAVGLVVFRWLHARWSVEAASESESPSRSGASTAGHASQAQPAGNGRRQFLGTGAAVLAGSLLAGGGGQLLRIRNDVQGSRTTVAAQLKRYLPKPLAELPARSDFTQAGTPSFITRNAQFYRIDTALTVPSLRAEDWSLRVHGMVDKELTLDFEQLLRRGLERSRITMACVSNEVGGDLISTSEFAGVSLRDLLAEAGVSPQATQLIARSEDGWNAGTPVDVVTEPDRGAMLAVAMNGEPLPAEHGFPVRMVVPGLYGYVSGCKWIRELELSTFDDFDPYWVKRGWSQKGPIKTQSRIDRPKGFERVTAGTVTIAGVAWAQTRGISKVEVRIDDGPWKVAGLSAIVNRDTWRMWKLDTKIASGSHKVQCRATDETGTTQTRTEAGTVPDGATGWHTLQFTAE